MTESQAALSEQRRVGMVNSPLASTAVGVVPPQRAGMASGVNHILLVAAIIALVSGVISLVASRGKDFAQQRGAGADR